MCKTVVCRLMYPDESFCSSLSSPLLTSVFRFSYFWCHNDVIQGSGTVCIETGYI